MGSIDRMIRILAAAGMTTLVATGTVSGTPGYILLGLAAVFGVTSVVSFCPLYAPLGMNTRAEENKESI